MIDDDPNDRLLAVRELSREFPEAELVQIPDAAGFEEAINKGEFDLVITDYHLGWSTGMDVLLTMKSLYPRCPIIMFTGTGSQEIAVAAMKAGITDYIVKSPNHFVQLLAAVRSSLERVESDQRTATLESRLHALLNQLGVGAFRCAPDGELLEASPAFLRLVGASSLREAHDMALPFIRLSPEEFTEFREKFEREGPIHDHNLQLDRPGENAIRISLTRTLNITPQRELVIDGLAEDVTERFSLEAQLRQSQKMESVGQLSAGLAHDFNNLLTVIQGYAGLLLSKETLGPRVVEPVRQIFAAAERAANLTHQLLAFSRKQVMQPRALDLNSVISNIAQLLRRTLGPHIQLQFDYSLDLPPIYADAGMLEQLLLNLAVNARDAMPRGGELVISTFARDVDVAHTLRNPDARVGRCTCLNVSDTGCGIEPTILPKIFEPFFTTKEAGRGTGLGLATVYGIAKQHQGWVEVASILNQGTSFQVYFPATHKPVEAPLGDLASLQARGGSETVLVVENASAVRELVGKILEAYGYRILEAASGLEALPIWEKHGEKIDLLMTNIVMPNGMTGRELAERLQTRKPALKVLFTTGFSPDVLENKFLFADGCKFLQKPYHPGILAHMVRECLDA